MILNPSEILYVTRIIIETLGTPKNMAASVANSLVEANLAGHDSHGVIRLLEYADAVRSGAVTPSAPPNVDHLSTSVIRVNGQRGWGPVAMKTTLNHLIPLASEHGVAVATTFNCHHIGRLGEYVEMIAQEGLVGLMWCNGDPRVAPFGGREPLLGTNPFAAGIPNPGRHPIVIDFATAAIAEEKVRLCATHNQEVPPGSIINAQGRPSTNPHEYYRGGALIPFGGHKGYGLSLLIELLGGGLSGNHPGTSPDHRGGNGVVTTIYNPEVFVSFEEFYQDIIEATDQIHSCLPAAYIDHVMLPGDLEDSTRKQRIHGIPMDEQIWQEILTLFSSLTEATLEAA
ncbi:MAG: Ldh family oxidoreductase [Propionibacteriaceae bacterium]|jgi:uncharacterized oxidoreductase|nr:Ldh family oxidoreductase [Propionibacteriaceae bacterium]